MAWFVRLFGIVLGPDMKSTERVIVTLFSLGSAMILAIVLFGIGRGVALHSGALAATFIFWSLATAFVTFLVGSATGLLFGLPTARRVEFDNSAAAATGTSQVSTGYVESTSLEQIADFLVKGLIALTLTTFDSWSARFDLLAGNVTATILGQPAPCAVVGKLTAGARVVCTPVDRVPGGLMLAGFALLGFLIGYLWMRRWFIAEMVTARSEERRILEDELKRINEAKANSRVGTGASSANNADAMQAAAERAATNAVDVVAPQAQGSAAEIAETVAAAPRDRDDPWKGAFGGSPAADGCILSANVSALVSDASNFQVDLLVAVSDDARRAELQGKIAHFYLHPSFGSAPQDVAIGADGRAVLQVFSYGAFTVGVLIDDGTRLELDLAQIPGAPQKFIER